jgi:hypothetical protein
MTTTTSVPSSDVSDFVFNVQKLDEITTGSALTYVDRLGVERSTAAGAMARFAALNPRGAWATATSYQPRDLVLVSGTWYIALDTHTSGATFAGDSAAHWRPEQGVTQADLADTSSASNGDALLGVKRVATGAVATTQHEFNSRVMNVYDYMTPALIADSKNLVPVLDHTASIQAAIDDASTTYGGGEIQLDGRFRLTSKLTIKSFVKLKGKTWLSNAGNGHWTGATTFFVDWGASADNHAVEMQYSSAIEGVMFYYPGQVDKDMKLLGVVQANPVEFGYTISTPLSGSAHDNIQIRNVSLVNSYKGIRLNNAGRWRVDNIQGDPLYIGFTASDCFDVCYLDSVHFWPFYADFPYAGAPGATATGTWKFNNGTGFLMYRVDGCMTGKVFVYGRRVGWQSDTGLWADIVNLLTDTCQYPYVQTLANKVRIANIECIGSAAVRTAVWYEDGGLLEVANGYINDTNSVGFQIGGSSGTVLIGNVKFDDKVTPLVSTGTAVKVKISNCQYKVPPFGCGNVYVDGLPLPDPSTAVTLPAPMNTPATAISGGYEYTLASVGSEMLRYDVTTLFERNSLYVFAFDYELVGDASSWAYEFVVSKDTGADVQVSYAPSYPMKLSTTVSQPTRRVYVPFFANFGLYRQILRLTVINATAVAGAKLKVTNIQLFEQNNKYSTDAQIAMMMTHGYNLDAFSMGQTLLAKGKNRIVLTQPEAGIGRATEVPIAGTWAVGDEVRVYNPVSGGPIGYVCTTAGTPGTWKAFGTIA